MDLRTKQKLDWLQKYGGDDATNKFNDFIVKASEVATMKNLPYKEASVGENDMIDDMILNDQDLSTQEKEQGSIGQSLVEQTDDGETSVEETESVEKEDVTETIETDETVAEDETVEKEEIAEETETLEDAEPVEKDGERTVTFNELEEMINTFAEDMFEPMMEILKEQRDRISELESKLEDFEKAASVLKEAETDLEIIPQQSVASLVKERLTSKLDGMVITKESVANDELVKQKPHEEMENTSAFSGFLSGM